MSTELPTIQCVIINNDEFVTRPQICEQFPIKFLDSQRWLEKHKPVIEHYKINKVIYYKRSDVAEYMKPLEVKYNRAEQLKQLRVQAFEKMRMIK